MRFLCFGVGAIGTYIGGSLALAGCPVTFIERPEVADIVRRRGLSLELRRQPPSNRPAGGSGQRHQRAGEWPL